MINELLGEVNWYECSTPEKLENLQRILIKANCEAYPQSSRQKRRVRRVPRSIKKLNAKKKEADPKQRRLSLQCTQRLRDGEAWTVDDQSQLDEAVSGYQEMVAEIKRRSSLIKLDKRAWMRAQLDIHNRQFWSLYDRTQKKKGKLTALKDADGELLTDIRKIENFALDHLALQFCCMRSPIFNPEVNRL